MPDRNPYVLLGIPFGSSREEANMAFARRAGPLRRQREAGRQRLTDLTWALNQIDEALGKPGIALGIYRVPADAAVLQDPAVVIQAPAGVLAPPPEPMTPPAGDPDVAVTALQKAAAWEYLRYLVRLHGERTDLPDP